MWVCTRRPAGSKWNSWQVFSKPCGWHFLRQLLCWCLSLTFKYLLMAVSFLFFSTASDNIALMRPLRQAFFLTTKRSLWFQYEGIIRTKKTLKTWNKQMCHCLLGHRNSYTTAVMSNTADAPARCCIFTLDPHFSIFFKLVSLLFTCSASSAHR